MNFKILTLFLFIIASSCKSIRHSQPRLLDDSYFKEKRINPNMYSFHCDSIINEPDVKSCIFMLFSDSILHKDKNKIESNDFNFIVSYQHKYAVPYRLTVKPSFNIYRISCDSIYKNEYLGSIVIFAPTPEGRTNFIFTYIDYGRPQHIRLYKDPSNSYFIQPWIVAKG